MTKKFIPLAKKVIDLEIQALQKLKKKIDNSFNKAVVEIAKCKSKVILCGVGKSGLIAAKISATLSSVGPIGLQIICNKNEDEKAVEIALSLEKHFGEPELPNMNKFL